MALPGVNVLASRACLSKRLASKGLRKSDFDFPLALDPSLQTWIAVRISDWKCCAAYLGLSQDIDDIVIENTKVRNRRTAMLDRWNQLKGKEATCLKLLETMAEMGRNDLVESVLDLILTKIAEWRRVYQDEEDVNKAARKIRHTICHTLLLLLQASECSCVYRGV